MKKVVCVIILAAAAAGTGTVWGFDLPEFQLAAGVGGFFSLEPGGGVEGKELAGDKKITKFMFGGGAYGFFDATYVEVSAGFGLGALNRITEVYGSSDEDKGSYMEVSIAVLGKFPFVLASRLSLFPLLGAEYRLCLSAKYENGDQYIADGQEAPLDLSAIWIRVGCGLDFAFTANFFLRAELIYGIRLTSKEEDDLKNTLSDGKTLLGHGGVAKAGIGYRF
jgi:hypothetical protein